MSRRSGNQAMTYARLWKTSAQAHSTGDHSLMANWASAYRNRMGSSSSALATICLKSRKKWTRLNTTISLRGRPDRATTRFAPEHGKINEDCGDAAKVKLRLR